jgi:AraC-like DNA-binding protein
VGTDLSRQTFRERRPAAALSRYVTCLWVQEVARDSAPYLYRTVPHGSAEIVVRGDGSACVVGPQTGPVNEMLAPGTTMVGIRLRPGTVPAVFGRPAVELVDTCLDVSEVWGRRAAAPLAGILAGAGSPRAAAAALEAALAARLTDAPDPDPIVQEVVQRLMPGRTDEVAALPALLSVSERHLRRRCGAAVGVAPKVLHRMLRFQSFLAMVSSREGTGEGRLAKLAADAGFADQSHLTREALRLAGRTPHTILVESDRFCACSHNHSASHDALLPAG